MPMIRIRSAGFVAMVFPVMVSMLSVTGAAQAASPSQHGSPDPGSGVQGSSGIMGQTPEPPAATSAQRRPMPTPRADTDAAKAPDSGATVTTPGSARTSPAKPGVSTANPASTPRDTSAAGAPR